MSKLDPIIGEPVAGEPNPELERVSGPQKVFVFLIAVGFIVLIGLLADLPSVAKLLR
ncbi:hypothetical protein [Nitrobacter sp. Nb-311A]|uniref:hypothetical protein n=1 Tax=Nitrobacter sp. Nb-311A TaxID=314253 RepID=UPI0002E13CB0|nr:hypothetical protein [Nitrobacter sp. Nb-311A]